MGAVAFAMAPVLRFMQRLDDDAFYVQAIGVDPEARGLGIGTRLMADTEQRAHTAGARYLELDVAETNPDARRLYERLGFAVIATSPTARGMPRTRVHRMRLDLARA